MHIHTRLSASYNANITLGVTRQQRVYHILLALFCVYTLIGVFPLMCYESDSMHGVAGCAVMYNEGWQFPPRYAYFYDMQPLITYTVAALRHVLAFLSCEQIYCLFTAISALLSVLGTLRLMRLITGHAPWLLLLAVFFFPESYAQAMYPNSTTPAFALFVWALCMAASQRYALATLLLCIAPLFRIDVVIVYPALLPLFLNIGMPWSRSLKTCSIMAISVVLFVAVACWMLGADPVGNTLRTYADFNQGQQYARQVPIALYTFFTPVNVILMPMGIYIMCSRRRYMMLIFCLLPMSLLYYMFRNTGCAAKHWLYILPFAAILAASGWQAIVDMCSRRKVLFALLMSMLAFYLFCGVRFQLPPSMAKVSKSFVTLDSTDGPFLTLFSEHRTPLKVRVGLGTGQIVPTADEVMLLTGNACYPLFIHNYKQRKDLQRRQALQEASRLDSYDIFAMEWGGRMFFPNLLIDEQGWHFRRHKSSTMLYTLTRGRDTIRCLYDSRDILSDDTLKMRGIIHRLAASPRPVVIVPETEARTYLLNTILRNGGRSGSYPMSQPHPGVFIVGQ